MVPVVFGTAWLVVTMLLRLVPSGRSLLPSAKQRGKTQRVTGRAAQGPCAKHQESNSLSCSFIRSRSSLRSTSSVPGSVTGAGGYSGAGDRHVPVIPEGLSRSLSSSIILFPY